MAEQAKLTFSPFGKAFEKQIKTIGDQREKQLKAVEDHGKQLAKSSTEKEFLTPYNKKIFLKNFLIKE